ncbi:MAG: cytochrome P450 [Frankia sp.]
MKLSKEIPQAPRGLPVLGHVVPMVRDPLNFLASMTHEEMAGQELVRLRIGPFDTVLVTDPALTRKVLHEDDVYDKGGPVYTRIREVLGNGLATCPYGEHRRQRRLIQPMFQQDRFPTYARSMVAQIEDVTGRWHDGQVLDVPAEMLRLAARVSMATLFSSSLPEDTMRELVSDLGIVVVEGYRRMVSPALINRFPTAANRRDSQARTRLNATLGEIIAERRSNGEDHSDLLSALLLAGDPTATNGLGFDDAEVRDQVVTFFAAGSETTATTMSWVLYMLGRHPEIEQRVRAEIDSVLTGSIAEFEHLPALKYTTRVVTETLRMYPPAWLISRTVTSDTELGGHTIPAGATLLFSPYLIHHRGDVFPDPEHFDPDRWENQRREFYFPFGGGARKCIGDQFSLTEVVLAVATIVARWRLTIAPDARVRAVATAAVRPEGLHMHASPQKGRTAVLVDGF